MSFQLIQDELLYLKTVTRTEDGTWTDGVYYPNLNTIPTVTYPTFEGDWEPMSNGQKTRVLPEGLQSSYTIIVITEQELSIATDISNTSFKEGSVIYLEDPATNTSTLPFDVFDKEEWHGNGGFELLDSHNAYICIRREKQ